MSVRMLRGIAWLLVLSVALTGRSARATSDRADSEEIVRRWADGPVRYLMTGKEIDEVRELTTIPDLARFITQFWKRRDPTPKTLVNEYRLLFWDRVRTANLMFQDSAEPGWKSDRGRILILMGEPNQIESDDVRVAIPDTLTITQIGTRTSGESTAMIADAGAHEVLRWHYMRRRSQIASPEFIVAFVRDETGAWRLSSDAKYSSTSYSRASTDPSIDTSFGHPEMRATANREAAMLDSNAMAQDGEIRHLIQEAGGDFYLLVLRMEQLQGDFQDLREAAISFHDETTGEMTAAQAPPADSGLFANYDLGLEVSAPPVAEMAVAEVTARDFLSAFTPEPRFEFFRARDGSTFVNIGARVAENQISPDGDLRLYARVSKGNDAASARFASNESQVDAGGGTPRPRSGPIETWTGLALPPGHYDVTLALEDTGSGHVGRGQASIEVPDLSGEGPRLSTPILANELTTASGTLAVAVRSSGAFARTETFALYYEVYGLPEGERFTAVYRFYRESTGKWIPIGKPIEQPDRSEGAQGWSFPLEKWPPGRYRVEIRVRAGGADRGGEAKEAAESVEFSVVE